MRMKVRMPKTNYQRACKITSRSITVSANEYDLMNFLGIYLFIKEKTSNKNIFYK
jgi:hypothetical protein